jgi:hypothetical protein
MFNNEHHNAKKSKNQARKGFFGTGTALAGRGTVNRRITYKELTLLAGVIVALIIVFTVWLHRKPETGPGGRPETVTLPENVGIFPETVKPAARALVQKAAIEFLY